MGQGTYQSEWARGRDQGRADSANEIINLRDKLKMAERDLLALKAEVASRVNPTVVANALVEAKCDYVDRLTRAGKSEGAAMEAWDAAIAVVGGFERGQDGGRVAHGLDARWRSPRADRKAEG